MLDFLGIGAQKAGTTWLYEMLCQHPQLAFPGGKEMHFWDAGRSRGLEWYRSCFNVGEKKNGEITPAYAMLPVETIREIHALNPALRVIYILRNPIDRAWSSARMALERAEMTLAEASDQWFIDHFLSQGSLRRGDYESCIRHWRQVFGTEQLLLLRYETIRADPRGLLRACCEHLGIESDPWVAALPDESIARRVFAGAPVAIRPILLPTLLEVYQPRIRSLAGYLGMDLSSWLPA